MSNFINQEKKKVLAQLHNADFQLQDLVDASNMSRSKYINTFKEAFGKTPIAYVNEMRMQKAAHLIETTDLTMKRIAFECGFTDRHYFCRCFKQTFKMTTTEYKRKIGK